MPLAGHESTGSTRLDQASNSRHPEFFARRARLYKAWRAGQRATDARMGSRYPRLYGDVRGDVSPRLTTSGDVLSAPMKNVKRRVRKSDSRDRKSLAFIKGYEARAAAADAGPFSRQSTPSLYPTPSSSSHPHLSTSEGASPGLPSHDNDNLLDASLPSWVCAGDRLKLTCVARAVAASSGGLAFSLNLSSAVETKARTLGADWLRKRIAHHLKGVLGTRGVVLVLEATGGRKDHGEGSTGRPGRLHAHGIVEASVEEASAVEGALVAAGGRWEDPRGNVHQVVVKPMTNADGWIRYILGDLVHTRRVTGHDRLISTSKSLKDPGKKVLEELREKYSKKRSTKEDVIIAK